MPRRFYAARYSHHVEPGNRFRRTPHTLYPSVGAIASKGARLAGAHIGEPLLLCISEPGAVEATLRVSSLHTSRRGCERRARAGDAANSRRSGLCPRTSLPGT